MIDRIIDWAVRKRAVVFALAAAACIAGWWSMWYLALDAIPENKPPTAVANCSGGARIVDCSVFRNTFAGTWRVILKMIPPTGSKDAVDLRCSLQQGTNVVGETWTYQWSPP